MDHDDRARPQILPADWPRILEGVAEALGQAVAEASRRERDPILVSAPVQEDVPSATSRRHPLESWQGRLEARQEGLQGIDRDVNHLAEALAEEEAALREWLRSAESASASLAGWATRSRRGCDQARVATRCSRSGAARR